MEKDSEQGSYSSTSVIKFTSWPLLEIDNLRSRFLNAYTNSFTGIYFLPTIICISNTTNSAKKVDTAAPTA